MNKRLQYLCISDKRQNRIDDYPEDQCEFDNGHGVKQLPEMLEQETFVGVVQPEYTPGRASSSIVASSLTTGRRAAGG